MQFLVLGQCHNVLSWKLESTVCAGDENYDKKTPQQFVTQNFLSIYITNFICLTENMVMKSSIF